MIRLAVVFWLACGILSAGIFNKSLDDHFHWNDKEKCEFIAARDQSASIIMGAMFGPAGLIIVTGFTGFGYRGWSLKRHECNY